MKVRLLSRQGLPRPAAHAVQYIIPWLARSVLTMQRMASLDGWIVCTGDERADGPRCMTDARAAVNEDWEHGGGRGGEQRRSSKVREPHERRNGREGTGRAVYRGRSGGRSTLDGGHSGWRSPDHRGLLPEPPSLPSPHPPPSSARRPAHPSPGVRPRQAAARRRATRRRRYPPRPAPCPPPPPSSWATRGPTQRGPPLRTGRWRPTR